MVSLLTPTAEPQAIWPLAPLQGASTPTHGRRRGTPSPRTRTDAYPRNPVSRHLLRVAYAIPFALIAVAAFTGGSDAGTPNAGLLARAASIDWSRSDIGWASALYPPVSTLFAALVHLLPAAPLLLSLAGAGLAGLVLQRMQEGMVQRGFRPSTAALLLLGLAANPLFAYTATQNLPSFLALSLVGMGLFDLTRFVAWGNTEAGFRAGILFLLAALSAPEAIAYVLIAGAASALLRTRRSGQRGLRLSNLIVVLFPTVAAVLLMAFLELVYLGRPFAFLIGSLSPGRDLGALLVELVTTPLGWSRTAPVGCAWLVAIAVRRPTAILMSSATFAALVLGMSVGLLPVGAAGNTFVIMALMAIAFIPGRLSAGGLPIVNLAGALLILIGWVSAFERPETLAFLARVMHDLLALLA